MKFLRCEPIMIGIGVLVIAMVGNSTTMAQEGDPTALFTFGYTDLDGQYDGRSTWSMQASQITAGDVTGGVPPFATALFDPGFVNQGADFTLQMALSKEGNGQWSGDGRFMITDPDSDTILGAFEGDWVRIIGSAAAFNGAITDIVFNETGGGATFDGTHGGSLDMEEFDFASVYGAVVVLHAGGWFDDGAFKDVNSLVQGTVVPAPGAALLTLLGIGTFGAYRKRLKVH